jgi:hypothetical protein
MQPTPGQLLEAYSAQHPQEVLLVMVEVEGEIDQILIFKGFSSSLLRSTAADPEIPVLPENTKILSLDRLHSPYHPNNPRYIQQELTWEDFQVLAKMD